MKTDTKIIVPKIENWNSEQEDLKKIFLDKMSVLLEQHCPEIFSFFHMAWTSDFFILKAINGAVSLKFKKGKEFDLNEKKINIINDFIVKRKKQKEELELISNETIKLREHLNTIKRNEFELQGEKFVFEYSCSYKQIVILIYQKSRGFGSTLEIGTITLNDLGERCEPFFTDFTFDKNKIRIKDCTQFINTWLPFHERLQAEATYVFTELMKIYPSFFKPLK